MSKATAVPILGDEVKCQKLSHECRGVFICSLSEPDLWNGYKRYDCSVETSLLSPSPPLDLNEQERNARVEQTVACVTRVSGSCSLADCPPALDFTTVL